jgi:hypothetical protein
MAKPQVSARLDEGLHDDFEEFVENNDMTKAEAIRMLIRDGLEANEQNIEEELRSIRDQIPMADGGIPSRAEVKRLQKAMTLQTAALGSGVLYASALSSFDLPSSAVAIFGGIVLILLGFAVYRLLGVIKNGGTGSTATPGPEANR